MNINIGDKVVAKKSTWIADEGKIADVTEVTDNSISFAFDGNPKVSCKMDFDTFNEYFAKVDVEEKTEEAITYEITEEHIADIMEEAEFEIYTTFDKCTIVSCRLPNGFVITESSACVSPENYNEEIGFENCYEKIVNKVWELEAYRLQQHLWEKSLTEECPFGCVDCDECPCDGEYCEE